MEGFRALNNMGKSGDVTCQEVKLPRVPLYDNR